MINLPTYINQSLKKAVQLSPALILFFLFTLPSLAQTNISNLGKTEFNSRKQETKPSRNLQLIQFPSSPDRGKPKRTGAAGRRGSSCISTQDDEPSLTAIMPTWDNEGKAVDTTSTLYVFVPKNDTKIGEFVVIDEEGNDVYQANFTPPSQPGIIPITIPPTVDIKIGGKYQWYFTLICNADDRSEDEYLTGSLERATLGTLLNNSLQKATAFKKAEIFARQNIWYDTIHNVASLRNQNPQLWISLLESVGLEKLANQPFVEITKTEPQ